MASPATRTTKQTYSRQTFATEVERIKETIRLKMCDKPAKHIIEQVIKPQRGRDFRLTMTAPVCPFNTCHDGALPPADLSGWRRVTTQPNTSEGSICTRLAYPGIYSILERAGWPNEPPTANHDHHIRTALASLTKYHLLASQGGRFATTEQGRFGCVPEASEPGDLVAVLYGGKVPCVIRHVEVQAADDETAAQKYVLVGDCYIHDIMWGADVREYRGNKVPAHTVVLL